MALIDNKNQTLQEALKNALLSADSVDIAVGFFYFSGFQALFDQLKDKKIRILVGLEVDPQLVPMIVQQSKEVILIFPSGKQGTTPTLEPFGSLITLMPL